MQFLHFSIAPSSADTVVRRGHQSSSS